jgi:ferredoxin
MADKSQKVSQNVPGAYYVDQNCIDCGTCYEVAPNCFKQDEETNLAYVYKQPESDQDKKACKEAMEQCPVDAIGDDG